MRDTPLTRLMQCGQSIWLDGIARPMLLCGELVSLVQEDVVSGVFERGIAEGSEYDGAISALAREGLGAGEIYQTLATDDARLTASSCTPCTTGSAGGTGS